MNMLLQFGLLDQLSLNEKDFHRMRRSFIEGKGVFYRMSSQEFYRMRMTSQNLQNANSEYAILAALECHIYAPPVFHYLSGLPFLQSVLVRLHSMGLSRCASPLRLVQSNDEEEEFEGMDINEFLQQLSGLQKLNRVFVTCARVLWLKTFLFRKEQPSSKVSLASVKVGQVLSCRIS